MAVMDLSKALAGAVERAAIKRTVAAALAKLPLADRRSILIELLAESDEPTEPAPGGEWKPPPIAQLFAPPSPSAPNGKLVTVATAALVAGPANGPTAQVVSLLGSNPHGLKGGELTAAIFGNNATAKMQSRIRSVLWALNKQGRVQSLGKGRWALKGK